MTAKVTLTDEEKKRKAFIKRELDRLAAIPSEDMLPGAVPFVRKYERELEAELQRLEPTP